MHKVHMHAGAIRQLLYGSAYVREIIHSLKLVDYPLVHTHKPYNNIHIYFKYLTFFLRREKYIFGRIGLYFWGFGEKLNLWTKYFQGAGDFFRDFGR